MRQLQIKKGNKYMPLTNFEAGMLIGFILAWVLTIIFYLLVKLYQVISGVIHQKKYTKRWGK